MTGRATKRIVVTGMLGLVALGGWAAWRYSTRPDSMVSRAIAYFRGPRLPEGFASGNGRIEATAYDVSTKRPTRIIKVLVKEGDLVEPGQEVVQMDTADLDADLRTSEAQLAQAREDLRRAIATVTLRESDVRRADAAIAQRGSEVRRAGAAIAQRESELLLAGQDVERAQPLLAPGAINRQEFDQYVSRRASAQAVLAQAQAGREAAEGALVEARAQRQVAQAALMTARIDVDFRQRGIDAAEARVQRIKTDIDDSTLKSPILGRVQVKVAEPGEVLSAGGRVLNLIDLTDVYMTFFLPTATAGRVSLGAEVRLVLDAAPDLVIPARTTFVSDVAQFTPKTVETKVEREKLMFRIKAHIPAELLKQHIRMVKTGLPGVAYVRLDPDAKWPNDLAVKLPQ
jgi:HlyD family secretion protein